MCCFFVFVCFALVSPLHYTSLRVSCRGETRAEVIPGGGSGDECE